MANEEDQAAFKVEDRRRFDASGSPREQDEQGGQAMPDSGAAGAAPHPGTAEGGGQAGAGGRKHELTFSSFVVGLATQALMFMGAIPAPSGQQVERNLDEASVIIDILSMLERKTAGNLEEDEARLIEDILYDLRMRFVRETRAKAEQGSQPE